MGRSAISAGRQAYLATSDARIAKLNDDLLTKLIDAAISTLHHDTTEGSTVDLYERDILRKKFARILKIKLPERR